MPTFKFASVIPLDNRTKLGPVAVNLIVQETHRRDSIVTRAPVDGESDRAHHIIPEPRIVSLTGVVVPTSDSLVDQPSLRFISPREELPPALIGPGFQGQAVINALTAQRIGAFITDAPQRPGTAVDNYATAWARWMQLIDSKTLVDYVSQLGVMTSMFIHQFEVEKDEREGHFFTAELIEFRYAGVRRDRWLTADIIDDARDVASVGTRTPVESDVDTRVDISPGIAPEIQGFGG